MSTGDESGFWLETSSLPDNMYIPKYILRYAQLFESVQLTTHLHLMCGTFTRLMDGKVLN